MNFMVIKLLTSHKTQSFYLISMSAKLTILNVIKLSTKPSLRLTLASTIKTNLSIHSVDEERAT